MKNWVVNFKSKRLLSYIQKKTTQKIDAKNIQVLDKESRQKRTKSLITNNEIKGLIKTYSDPVYAAMFTLSLGTAMRPIELCGFPYIGNASNKHIMDFSEMAKTGKTVEYTLIGKGNKTRTIKININDLKELEDAYINKYYNDRKIEYRKRYGHDCPPTILFLNNKGVPVTPPMISSRTNYAKTLISGKDPDFREEITFYEARHWWPTMFLISFFKEKLLTQSADVLHIACAEALTNQMGHEDIATTFKHYVDMGRIIMLAHQGFVNELISEPDSSTMEFIEKIEGVTDVKGKRQR